MIHRGDLMILETKQLYEIQDTLDKRIFENHDVTREETTIRRLLALLVEVSELANETRCFKFWSNKPASEKAIVLEEYVDGIHFLLSLGIDLNVTPHSITSPQLEECVDLTDVFIRIYEKSCLLRNYFCEEMYMDTFETYLEVAEILGFSEQDITDAYFSKNEENHHRQDTNY